MNKEHLKSQKVLLEKRIKNIDGELKQLEISEKLLPLKEKFEGKLFKERESFDGKEWWRYYRCIEVINEGYMLADFFVTTPHQTAFINKTQHVLPSRLSQWQKVYIEITPQEYQEALNKVKESLLEMEVQKEI